MEKIIRFIEGVFSLTAEQQVFIIAVLAILISGLALYVVLAAIKTSSGKGGSS